MRRRCVRLPASGQALVSTDLHGNGDDFRALRSLFLKWRHDEPETHWVLLGDAIHGPSEAARAQDPELYDYDDESASIVEGIVALQPAHPGFVHYVLGNHDHGHVGGPHTAKFHEDEVEHLESRMEPAALEALETLLHSAALAVIAPCGVLMTHGSPDGTLEDVADLERIQFPPAVTDPYLARVLEGFINCYGQPNEVTERLLETVSRGGEPIHVVIHGHDRDAEGFYKEEGDQLCPVLFGARRELKTFVRLDLATSYGSVDDFVLGREIMRLHRPTPRAGDLGR